MLHSKNVNAIGIDEFVYLDLNIVTVCTMHISTHRFDILYKQRACVCALVCVHDWYSVCASIFNDRDPHQIYFTYKQSKVGTMNEWKGRGRKCP